MKEIKGDMDKAAFKTIKKELLISFIFSFALLVFTIPIYSPLGLLGVFIGLPGKMVIQPLLPEQVCEDPVIDRLQDEQMKIGAYLRSIPYQSKDWYESYSQQAVVLDELGKAQNKYRECKTTWANSHPPRSAYSFFALVINFFLYAGIVFIVFRIVAVVRASRFLTSKKE